MYFAVLPVAVLTMPMEVRLLGLAMGFAASSVCLLPGRRPLIETVVRYVIGMALYVSVFSGIVSWSIQTSGWTLVLVLVLLASWWKARMARHDLQRIGSLEFEERQQPAVQTLSIERH